jgi:signal transduction histidine kinase/ActR/RegA family two-component response regulator
MVPAVMDEPALRRRLLEEGWEAEARSDRWLAGAGGAALLLAWISDMMLLGPTPLAFVLLGVRVLATAMLVPSFVASLAKRPPERLDRARLLLVASAVPVLVLIALHPTSLAADGWGMVAAWTLLAIWANVPLLPKIATLGSSYLLFLVHLWLAMAEHGEAYGETSQVVTVVVCGALAVLVVPWLPHRTELHRLRELETRLRLEQEIGLREQREREAREAGARADRAAVQARQAAHKAQEEARLRTELFANMSHDLRTPMAGILGIVELMQDTPLTEEQAGFIATIRASNQTLLSLLDDVIDFARIEEGKLPIAPTTVPLAETLQRPAELMRVTAERKQLRLHVDLSPGLPRHVKLDPARVQQVLLNLLGNAVKFTQHGGVTLRASMRDRDGRRVLRVEVEDTGIGFTEAQAPRLFRRFSQAEDKTVHRFGGSGLGLSICKSLVDLMGGRIGAERRAEQGALFWFELPIEASEAPVAAEQGPALPKLRVLLAEDNPVNQLVASTMLKKLGQSVTVASDGEQALSLLLRESFDLAIIDMQMPIMDGVEVAHRVRSTTGPASTVRIVALTAAAEPEKRAEFLAAGVDAVYTKPIDMTRLRHLVQVEGATGAGPLHHATPQGGSTDAPGHEPQPAEPDPCGYVG